MKSFRLFLSVALFAVVSCTLLSVGCKSKCGTTTCQNAGTCANNVCVCPTGFSGNACQSGWSDASIGTYDCTRSNCSPTIAGATTWKSAVTKAATGSGYTIDISNFDNSNTTIVGTIDSLQNISISPATGTYGINASGRYANGKITLHFTTSSSGGVGGYTCDMTMVKE